MGFQSLLDVSNARDRGIESRSYPVKAPEELQVARLVPLGAAEGVPRVVGIGVVECYDGILALAWIKEISKAAG